MSVNQTQPGYVGDESIVQRIVIPFARIRRIAWIAGALFVTLALSGGGAIPASEARTRSFATAAAGWGFNLLHWETGALAEKARALLTRPAADLPPRIASLQVLEYMDRAAEMGRIERDLSRIYGANPGAPAADAAALHARLDELRAQQDAMRPTVEQVIQGQVGSLMEVAGFTLLGEPFPPVQFTFTEPPKKLVVSRRDQIATVYSRMLAPQIRLAEIQASEAQIDAISNASGYITNIGGLGAFPTMVVDRASLSWVLSTVAHEWVHNLMVFYPLGWNYFKSQDMTTINETVAEIAGNEIGAETLRQYYPEPSMLEPAVEAEQPGASGSSLGADALGFDFREEMRRTRQEVDRLLAAGKVEEAEAYMERRRDVFVDNGYPLRVLNQAYFAFHGSYGTSAASTSPIGPKLERLRQLSPDLKTFIDTVKWFTSPEDLDAALAEGEATR